jgi:hypothetical protein
MTVGWNQNTLQTLKQSKGGLFLHQQGIGTSTAAGNAFFQMLGVFAEFERAIIVERVNAGIARAKANGTKPGRLIGRPPLKTERLNAARAALADGQSIHATALAAGISVGSAAALKKEMAGDQPRPSCGARGREEGRQGGRQWHRVARQDGDGSLSGVRRSNAFVYRSAHRPTGRYPPAWAFPSISGGNPAGAGSFTNPFRARPFRYGSADPRL